MGRNSAHEENLLSRLEGIRAAVDETKKLRIENARLSRAAERAVGALRELVAAETEFVAVNAELADSEEADHEGGPPDTLIEEHGVAHTRREAAWKVARDLLAETEKG